jgi:hypothetical protein
MSNHLISPLDHCVSFIHSDTGLSLRRGALLITTAVAAIALIGSILGALAFNGVNIGPLNIITSLVSEQYVYIGLVGGTGLTLINTVLISNLMRKFYDKQYSKEELSQFNLNNLKKIIYPKLENDCYWLFPKKFIRHDPSVFGFFARNSKGNPGYYAYKNHEDMNAQIRRLNYKNGEELFTTSDEFFPRYLNEMTSQETKENIQMHIQQPLDEGVYRAFDFQMDDCTEVYALQLNAHIRYFKNVQSRDKYSADYIEDSELQMAIDTNEVVYLEEGSAWLLEEPVRIVKSIEEEEKVFLRYILVYRKKGSEEREIKTFSTLEEVKSFQKKFTDAKSLWNDAHFFPRHWVENYSDKDDLEELENIELRNNEFALLELKAPRDSHFEIIYALKIKIHDEYENYFFKTKEALEDHIKTNFSRSCLDKNGISSEIEKGKDKLPKLLNEEEKLIHQFVLHGENFVVVYRQTQKGIEHELFRQERAKNLTPNYNKINSQK